MLDKILNRIKNSDRITEYSKVNSNGHKIDNKLSIETWNGHCTGIYIDGMEVKIYSNSHEDERKIREQIRMAIRDRINEIKQELINNL